MLGGVRGALHKVLSTALPSLRVVALAYTGLSAMGLFVLVVAAATTPQAPIVERVTQPARQAATTMSGMMSPPVAAVAPTLTPLPSPSPLPSPAPFVASARLDVVIDSPPAVLDVTIAPVAPVRSQPLVTYVPPRAPAPTVDESPEDPDLWADDDVSTEDTPQRDAAVVEEPIVQAPLTLQAASVEAPTPLPTAVPIPLTAAQVKAQMDAANQAAIDAIKATATATKARDDAANQAAIDALKAARGKH